MSVLESIRKRTGLLVGLTGLALLIFILEALLGSGRNIFSSDERTVGEIDGEKIDYIDFQNLVNQQINNIMQMNPNANVDENMKKNITENVWTQLINEKVIYPQYQKAGISISDEELFYLMLVEPHQMLLQQLTDQKTGKIYEGFANPDGSLDTRKLQMWVNQMNPDQERFWKSMEKAITDYRKAEKYSNLIKKSLYTPKLWAEVINKETNNKMNITYAMKKYDAIKDSEIKYTEEDLEKYYKDHKYEFNNTVTTRVVEYVSFDVIPTEEDIKNIEKEMKEVAEKFKETKEDSSFIQDNNEGGELIINNFTKTTLIIPDSNFFNAPVGYVYGPFTEGNYFKIYKLLAKQDVADSARVRHILIGLNDVKNNKQRTKERAKAIADSLLTLIKEKKVSFDTLVKTVSDDPGSVDKGGDYGWFTETTGFVEPFKNAGLLGKKGDISVVETQFGYHIIEVLDVSKNKHLSYRVGQIYREIAPSTETTNKYYSEASSFAGNYNTSESFDKGVEKLKLAKRILENIHEGDNYLPGLENSKEFTRWVYKAKKGEVSPVFEFKNKFIVAKLTHIKDKGILPLDEVKEEVITKVIRDKKADKMIQEFKSAYTNDITTLANKLSISTQKQENLTFSSFNVFGIGREDALIGTAYALPLNKLSQAVKGENGVFVVIKNNEKMETATDLKMLQKQNSQMLGSRAEYEVYNALKEKANIQDYRGRFDF
ncbi:MAG: SurA N-terminal domain-containing protein [Bacteroidia bacterium]|nr:SurA N-terminal domain-containing protein [Bacteroidia bacterium]